MDTKPNILLLDDDENWFEIVQYKLGNEYDLVYATDLKTANEWLKTKNFHLIIVDLNLEDGIDSRNRDGYKFMEEIRSTEILRDTSVIVLSQHDDSGELRTSFKDFQVYDFVSKAKIDELPFKEIVNEAIAASYGGVI